MSSTPNRSTTGSVGESGVSPSQLNRLPTSIRTIVKGYHGTLTDAELNHLSNTSPNTRCEALRMMFEGASKDVVVAYLLSATVTEEEERKSRRSGTTAEWRDSTTMAATAARPPSPPQKTSSAPSKITVSHASTGVTRPVIAKARDPLSPPPATATPATTAAAASVAVVSRTGVGQAMVSSFTTQSAPSALHSQQQQQPRLAAAAAPPPPPQTLHSSPCKRTTTATTTATTPPTKGTVVALSAFASSPTISVRSDHTGAHRPLSRASRADSIGTLVTVSSSSSSDDDDDYDESQACGGSGKKSGRGHPAWRSTIANGEEFVIHRDSVDFSSFCGERVQTTIQLARAATRPPVIAPYTVSPTPVSEVAGETEREEEEKPYVVPKSDSLRARPTVTTKGVAIGDASPKPSARAPRPVPQHVKASVKEAVPSTTPRPTVSTKLQDALEQEAIQEREAVATSAATAPATTYGRGVSPVVRPPPNATMVLTFVDDTRPTVALPVTSVKSPSPPLTTEPPHTQRTDVASDRPTATSTTATTTTVNTAAGSVVYADPQKPLRNGTATAAREGVVQRPQPSSAASAGNGVVRHHGRDLQQQQQQQPAHQPTLLHSQLQPQPRPNSVEAVELAYTELSYGRSSASPPSAPSVSAFDLTGIHANHRGAPANSTITTTAASDVSTAAANETLLSLQATPRAVVQERMRTEGKEAYFPCPTHHTSATATGTTTLTANDRNATPRSATKAARPSNTNVGNSTPPPSSSSSYTPSSAVHGLPHSPRSQEQPARPSVHSTRPSSAAAAAAVGGAAANAGGPYASTPTKRSGTLKENAVIAAGYSTPSGRTTTTGGELPPQHSSGTRDSGRAAHAFVMGGAGGGVCNGGASPGSLRSSPKSTPRPTMGSPSEGGGAGNTASSHTIVRTPKKGAAWDESRGVYITHPNRLRDATPAWQQPQAKAGGLSALSTPRSLKVMAATPNTIGVLVGGTAAAVQLLDAPSAMEERAEVAVASADSSTTRRSKSGKKSGRPLPQTSEGQPGSARGFARSHTASATLDCASPTEARHSGSTTLRRMSSANGALAANGPTALNAAPTPTVFTRVQSSSGHLLVVKAEYDAVICPREKLPRPQSPPQKKQTPAETPEETAARTFQRTHSCRGERERAAAMLRSVQRALATVADGPMTSASKEAESEGRSFKRMNSSRSARGFARRGSTAGVSALALSEAPPAATATSAAMRVGGGDGGGSPRLFSPRGGGASGANSARGRRGGRGKEKQEPPSSPMLEKKNKQLSVPDGAQSPRFATENSFRRLPSAYHAVGSGYASVANEAPSPKAPVRQVLRTAMSALDGNTLGNVVKLSPGTPRTALSAATPNSKAGGGGGGGVGAGVVKGSEKPTPQDGAENQCPRSPRVGTASNVSGGRQGSGGTGPTAAVGAIPIPQQQQQPSNRPACSVFERLTSNYYQQLHPTNAPTPRADVRRLRALSARLRTSSRHATGGGGTAVATTPRGDTPKRVPPPHSPRDGGDEEKRAAVPPSASSSSAAIANTARTFAREGASAAATAPARRPLSVAATSAIAATLTDVNSAVARDARGTVASGVLPVTVMDGTGDAYVPYTDAAEEEKPRRTVAHHAPHQAAGRTMRPAATVAQ